MPNTIVQYRVKPERVAENQALIEAVFAELEQLQPRGFSYRAFLLEDGVSFVHVVIEKEGVEDPDSLAEVPAFQAFVADIADRCDVPPAARGATLVGTYE